MAHKKRLVIPQIFEEPVQVSGSVADTDFCFELVIVFMTFDTLLQSLFAICNAKNLKRSLGDV